MAVNAIDFSDLIKNPQPETKLGIKNHETGEIEPAVGYPTNEMGQGSDRDWET